jgi:membrane-bound lytic murein transglycosylase D
MIKALIAVALLTLSGTLPALSAPTPEVPAAKAASKESAPVIDATTQIVASLSAATPDSLPAGIDSTAPAAPMPPAEAALTPDNAPITDLWQRIRAGLAMPESDDPLIRSHEASFSRRIDGLQNTLTRSRPYLFHIVEEVEKRGMPLEIALLPIIESSFNPQALSPSQAAGIWQFIPSTGRIYGLDQNHWYDGRRDIVAATKAALDHLQYLNRMFRDWELTLAAYNCGEGCVGRAIAKNRAQGLPTNFSALSLPSETRNYVPKLLAVRNMIRAPEGYALSLEELPNKAYFRTVTLPRPLEARAAAKLAGMNLDDFLDLNPGYRRNVIYSDAPSKLLLPVNKVPIFNRNLAQNGPEANWLRKYFAQKGESLKQIADRFDVSLNWLRDLNPTETGKRGQLKSATTMLVPASPMAAPAVVAAKPAPAAAVAKASAKVAGKAPVRSAKKTQTRRIHTVRKGDTLFQLAQRYNVAVADIKALNGQLKVLRPGSKLRIPVDNG